MKQHLWLAKALAQAAVCRTGLLPLYHAGQRRIGRLHAFHPRSRSEYAAKLVIDTADLQDLRGATVVEIGTGWVPVVPLLLHIMGAGEIVTYDLTRHLQPALTMKAVPLLRDCLDDLKRRTGLDTAPMQRGIDRLLTARDIGELLAMASIDYRAPADASRSGLPDRSVDIFYSNLVLEHISEPALKAIHEESRRILKPTGVAWHNIDFSDHYSHTRASLSPINFLRYSRTFWSLFGNNDILYQNRMRRSDHIALMTRCGLKIRRCVDHAEPQARAALAAGFRPHPDFLAAPEADLVTTSARVVAQAA